MMRMSSAVRKGHRVGRDGQSGFTLIEALVTAFILAVGIMGIVSLLSISKVSQHASIQRTRAVVLADDILERMRRNPAGMSVYHIGLSAPLGNTNMGAEQPAPNCRSAPCAADQLATHDLWAWEQVLMTTGLRNVSACIDFTADAGRDNTGIVDVVIQWQGLKETADAVISGGTVCGVATDDDATRRQVILNSYIRDEKES
jgi:type IV pilus assembly protein PilV